MRHLAVAIIALGLVADPQAQSRAGRPAVTQAGLAPKDLFQLQSIGDVQLSPAGTHLAYSVIHNDRPGRPYADVAIRDLVSGQVRHVRDASGVRWSPDGKWIAYTGRTAEGAGLIVANFDGEQARLIAPLTGTNHPLPSTGKSLAWSPDARFIAYLSATPGPETENANGDPMVVTRYLYKPTASEGETRFNDNRRLHVFIADVASTQVRQLTDGPHYEHSLDWSPKGDELLFVSNREADPDRVFNYDVFAARVADGRVRRVTATKSAEYQPVWSPDGTRIAFTGTTRDLTSSETTMEDTHVWVMRADGSERQEIGRGIDNRQGAPAWAADGTAVFFAVQERGSTTLVRVAVSGGAPETIVGERGSLGTWSLANDRVAYAFTRPGAPADLFMAEIAGRPEGRPLRNAERRHPEPRNEAGTRPGEAQALTRLNRELLGSRTIADVEAFTFKSSDGREIEAFLTKPVTLSSAGETSITGRGGSSLDSARDRSDPPGTKHPLIVIAHGGPHGQQGPAFNAKAQVYAGLGWASLMVNYRGSTGYGQQLTDAIFKDQNGGEARDVIAGVDAALARYPWLDGARLGIEGTSYGGQLANWIVTQTTRFKAAIPTAGIANLVSFNYMAYYHDYLAVEFGAFPHQQGIADLLWERSPIRLAKDVKTPTLFIHGENDNDVPIAEAEQFYVALHEVGVPAVLVRYPREGHGLRENAHVVDALERSIAWYTKYFE